MAEPPLEENLEGFLYKKGEFSLIGSPSWKRRWFKQDKHKLLYYEKGSKQPAGFIDLSEVTKVSKSSTPGPLGALNGFKLVTPTREWELQAESDRDMIYWMDGLVRCIAVYNARPTSPKHDTKRATSPRPPERAVSPNPAARAVSPQPQRQSAISPSPQQRALSPTPAQKRPVSPPFALEAPVADVPKRLLNAMPPLTALAKPFSSNAPASPLPVTSWQPRCTAPEARRSALPGIDLSGTLSVTSTSPALSANIQTSPRGSTAPGSPPTAARPLMTSTSTLSPPGAPSSSAVPKQDSDIMTSLVKESIAVTGAVWQGTVDLMMAPFAPFLPGETAKPPERSCLDDNPESAVGGAEEEQQLVSKSQLQQLFELPPDAELVDSYYCGYYTGNFYQRGVFYIFSCHICYNGRYALSGVSNTEKIAYKDIVSMERKNTAVVLPNGIEIEVKGGKKYFFGGFLRPHVVFDNIERLWKDHAALLSHPIANKPAKEKLNQLKFQERFGLGPQATLITQMSCAFYRIVYHVGQLYLSKGHVCFRAKAASLAGEIKEVIPMTEIVAVERRNSAVVIPNAIEIITRHTSYFFSSFLKRDQTADLLTNLWRQHAAETLLGSDVALRRIRPAGPAAGQQTQAEMRKEVLVSKGSAQDQEIFRRATRDEPGQVLLYVTRCTLTKGNVKQPTPGHVFVTLENIYFQPESPQNAASEKIPMKEVVAMERRPHSGIKTITTVTRYLMIHFTDREATYDEFVKAWNRKRSAVRLFGATLQAVLAKEPPGAIIPSVLQRCLTVLSEKGVREDGIFRAVPPQSEVAELRQKMEEAVGGDVEISRFGVHVIAAALKAFLKDLPEPLLGWQDPQLPSTPGTAADKLSAKLKTLPKENRAFLKELGRLLHTISVENASMPSAKLALVFAPLLYPPKDPNDLAQTAFAQELVRTYVEQALVLFPK